MAKLWLARWKNGTLHLYAVKPTKNEVYGEFWLLEVNPIRNSMRLNGELFPEVTYENSPVEVSLQEAPSLKEALKELEAIAQEALKNIHNASSDYANQQLNQNLPLDQQVLLKRFKWIDISRAFEAGVRWMANKHNITF